MTWVDSAVSIPGGSAGAVQADIDRLTVHTSGWVNVKSYGALGDGVTNDTAAIQAAYTSVTDGSALRLFFPAGTYVLNSTPTYGTRKVFIDRVGAFTSGAGTLPGIVAVSGLGTNNDGLTVQGKTAASELNPESSTLHLGLIPTSATRHQPGLAVCQESDGCANIWALGRPVGQQVATPASGGFDAKLEMYASDDACIVKLANQSGPNTYEIAMTGSQSPVIGSTFPVLYEHVVDIPGDGSLVLRSPNGSRWSLKVDNAGVLTVVSAP